MSAYGAGRPADAAHAGPRPARTGGRRRRHALKIAAALLLLLPALAAAQDAGPPPSAQALQQALEARLRGDRTGACMLAAVIGPEGVVRGAACAGTRRAPAFDDGFEIGSIAKTMLAYAVARRVQAGQWALSDPVDRHLPQARPAQPAAAAGITLQQLLTHTSGLPPLPPLPIADAQRPYASWSPQQVREAFAASAPAARPGGTPGYSNFGALVLSLAVDHAAADGIATELQSTLFAPLGMRHTAVGSNAAPPRTVQGHDANGRPVPPWTAAAPLTGAGFVVSTLDDMAAWAGAFIDGRDDAPRRALRQTLQPLVAGRGMAWFIAAPGGRRIALHEGGTGGFTSLAAIDAERRRAVVVLADTSLLDLGGLGDIGLALLGLPVPAAGPRLAQPLPAALAEALAGDYHLAGQEVRIWRDGDRLLARGAQGAAFELGFDSRGDLYPRDFGALLTPSRRDGAIDGFTWRQGGATLLALRAAAGTAVPPDAADVAALLGRYRLRPGFELRIFSEGGALRLQATGQEPFAAEAATRNRIVAPAIGLALDFERDATDAVTGLTLRQGSVTQKATKLPGP